MRSLRYATFPSDEIDRRDGPWAYCLVKGRPLPWHETRRKPFLPASAQADDGKPPTMLRSMNIVRRSQISDDTKRVGRDEESARFLSGFSLSRASGLPVWTFRETPDLREWQAAVTVIPAIVTLARRNYLRRTIQFVRHAILPVVQTGCVLPIGGEPLPRSRESRRIYWEALLMVLTSACEA
jgi:hypothetical protein